VARQAGAALGGDSLATPERHPPASATGRTVTYLVQPGDTLWSIAQRVAPERDPRAVVDALRDARDTDTLYPGEAITWVVE
jgi:Tfp pilus assembly protein FimV